MQSWVESFNERLLNANHVIKARSGVPKALATSMAELPVLSESAAIDSLVLVLSCTRHFRVFGRRRLVVESASAKATAKATTQSSSAGSGSDEDEAKERRPERLANEVDAFTVGWSAHYFAIEDVVVDRIDAESVLSAIWEFYNAPFSELEERELVRLYRDGLVGFDEDLRDSFSICETGPFRMHPSWPESALDAYCRKFDIEVPAGATANDKCKLVQVYEHEAFESERFKREKYDYYSPVKIRTELMGPSAKHTSLVVQPSWSDDQICKELKRFGVTPKGNWRMHGEQLAALMESNAEAGQMTPMDRQAIEEKQDDDGDDGAASQSSTSHVGQKRKQHQSSSSKPRKKQQGGNKRRRRPKVTRRLKVMGDMRRLEQLEVVHEQERMSVVEVLLGS